MREFREQAATLMTYYASARAHGRVAVDQPAAKEFRERATKITRCVHVIRLLIRERGSKDEEFLRVMDALVATLWRTTEPDVSAEVIQEIIPFSVGAEVILQRERAAITAPGAWSALQIHPRLGAVRWQLGSRFVAWCRRDPPRFRDLP